MKLDHFTINVTDMKAAEDFYGGLLGLPKLEPVDMGDHRIHYFDLGDGVKLELIEYDVPDGREHPAVKTEGIYRHFALEVDNVDTLYDKLKAAGTKILCEPGDVPKLHFRNILIEDPNGVEIEILQYI